MERKVWWSLFTGKIVDWSGAGISATTWNNSIRRSAVKKGLLLYLSNDAYSVCKVLKPRVDQLVGEAYPLIQKYYVDTEKSPLIAGQHRVFTIPTILLFFVGKENLHISRNNSLHQLEEAIEKPYGLEFEN